MTHHKTFNIIAILVLLLCPVAHAQETDSKPQTIAAARREKAIELLQLLATQLPTLQSPENRARIGANIADSLWPHDEKRARSLFISIEDDINWGLRLREVKPARDDHTATVFMQLRTDIMSRIAKHDSELALDFLTATRPDYEKWPPAIAQLERDFEVKLATQIVQSNPDLALKIGRRSLSSGFSNNLLPLLKQLHWKNREHGVALYKETVQALRAADFAHRRLGLAFARSLAEGLTPPLADEAAFRDYIELWISTALENGCDKPDVDEDSVSFCLHVRSLVPQMQKVAPLRTAQLKQLATEDKRQPWEILSARDSELYAVLEQGDFAEVLELAKKYPDMAPRIYSDAALKAKQNGDDEGALKIANEVADPEIRQRLLARLKAEDDLSEITDEQVQAELRSLTQVEQRISVLVIIANRVGRKNRARALKLLDQATGMIESLTPGKEQLEGQLGLALFYCTEKSDRGLAMMESLIPKLNELIDAAAKLDGFDTHYLREGEWNMSAAGPLGKTLTFLSGNAAYYAWTDFDRAVSLAAQFERPEIRMMAQAKLAQSILAGPPKRFKVATGLIY